MQEQEKVRERQLQVKRNKYFIYIGVSN